jgi:UDP-N-acetyl-D-galactosamine dehydrogenase
VDIYDPWADKAAGVEEYGLTISNELPDKGLYDGLLVAVSHREFYEMSAAELRKLGKPVHVLYDIKNVFPADQVDGRL